MAFTGNLTDLFFGEGVYLYVCLISGGICNSTFSRFGMRSYESQLVFFFLFLGECVVLVYFRQLSESETTEKFVYLFHAPEATYL